MDVRAAVSSLSEHWPRYWPGCDREALSADLLARLEDACRAWQLTEVVPFQNGVVGLACAARRGFEPCVVKLSPRVPGQEDSLAAEALALRYWQELGVAVDLWDARDDDLTLLLERLLPGSTLDDAGLDWLEVLGVLGEQAALLHARAGTLPELRHLSDYGAGWLAALEGSELQAELSELLLPRADDVLLHADLHGENVLRHGAGWRVIDPHGVVGDRHADVYALLCWQAPALPAAPAAARREAERWLEAYCHPAGLEPERAARWVVLRTAAALREADEGNDRDWVERSRRLLGALS